MRGTNVEVVTGDATALPFVDGRFSSAVSFTMLHHVPSAEQQNHVLAEVRRVLRPGGTFAGSDSNGGFLFPVADSAPVEFSEPPCLPISPGSLLLWFVLSLIDW